MPKSPRTPASGKPGSRSPKHRGYRPEEAAAPQGKRRWTSDDRAARDRTPAGRGERPDWSPREKPARGQRPGEQHAERPRRSEDRDQRPARFDRSDRPARDDRVIRDDRPARRFDRDASADRPVRADRGSRRVDRDARPARFERDDRGPRPTRFDRDQRPARHDRPARDSSYYPSKAAKPFESTDDVVLERLEAAMTTAADVEGVTFADLGLGQNIVRQLATTGAERPFPIQAATIPDVLAGRDVLGRGRTGSGKTIAFGAPLVERLMENDGAKNRKVGRAPRALILAPTRELAQQIDRTVQPIARSVGLFTVTIVGGVPQYKQVAGLQRGVDIVIGTPGRIEDLVEQGRLDLSRVTVTVLDEADHMCDLGFLEPVQRIIRQTRPGGQKLLFSATLDKGVAALVDEFLVEPAVHEVAGEDQASSTIEHRMLLIDHREKRRIVEELVSGRGRSLVFTRTRAFAEELAEHLEDRGIEAVSLHGDLTQSRRQRSLEKLTSGRVNVLVATDVAARGIHVDDISLVVQADAPEEYKTYLHRAGRTGRAGKQGTVVTLVGRNRRRKMDELLGRAEIEPVISEVAPGDDLLRELAAR